VAGNFQMSDGAATATGWIVGRRGGELICALPPHLMALASTVFSEQTFGEQ